MWDIVSKISTQRKKSSVIITTHSMEEAEALCTKMGIMVGGQFKCFGSSQHIKDKYGNDYEIEIKIRTPTEEEVNLALKKSEVFMDKINLTQAKAIILEQGLLSQEDLDKGKVGEEYFLQFERGE